MPEKGPVISIKFNQTQDILAVQRNNYNVVRITQPKLCCIKPKLWFTFLPGVIH